MEEANENPCLFTELNSNHQIHYLKNLGYQCIIITVIYDYLLV